MNAFFVPQLGSMIYTMAGMTTELNLSADHAGTFRGISSHYSGEGFSDMHFDMHVVGVDEFNRWIEETRATNKPLDAATYATLTKQSIAVAPVTYSAVDADLFKNIVSLAVPPGPGPATQAAGASQSAMER